MKSNRDRLLRKAAALTACLSTVASAGTGCARPLDHQAAASDSNTVIYCAEFPDTVGLYVGNPVTQMGYAIGTVEAITPHDTDVEVRFAVTTPRPLPTDVKAIIRSTSILADRALELVGNYATGPRLDPGECIPLSRSSTPKSLSETVGATAKLFNGITPDGSQNLADAMHGLDKLTHDNGSAVNQLLTRSSEMLDNPDRAIADMGLIVRNLKMLTDAVVDMRGPLKSVINDTALTTADVVTALNGATRFTAPLWMFVQMFEDLELRVGDALQLTLDTTSVAIQKLAPQANGLAHLFDVVPWWTNWFANHANNHRFDFLSYRPPMWRIRTPDGWALCGYMNANAPGSCANVGGQPYAADVGLLQYVFMKAAPR